jgi:hypothetical protein
MRAIQEVTSGELLTKQAMRGKKIYIGRGGEELLR